MRDPGNEVGVSVVSSCGFHFCVSVVGFVFLF